MADCLSLDFVLSFCKDMIPGHGEDCFCRCFSDTAGLLAVFDGCGGAGSRKHELYTDHSEAFMASRLCAGAFYDYFQSGTVDSASDTQIRQGLETAALQRLRTYAPASSEGGFRIKGSLSRTLPCTAAAAFVRRSERGTFLVSVLWAGDSRVYLWNSDGLAQLTTDHTSVPDAFETLYDDGILNNIFCSDRDVALHLHTIELQAPFLLFTATDGCFNYIPSPMEFEAFLLSTLLQAENVAQWKTGLLDVLDQIASDDHAMCLASFGYDTFSALHKAAEKRYQFLDQKYLPMLRETPPEMRSDRRKYWQLYQKDYLRYM